MHRAVVRWLPAVFGAISLLIIGELGLRARYRQHVLPAGRTSPDALTIVALGDSIAAGSPGPSDQAWPALLASRLRAEYPTVTWQAVNAGVPGSTAPMGYARFDRAVAAHAPDVALIAFGLNDCHRGRHALDRWFEARVPIGLERSYVWRALQARSARIGRRLGGRARAASAYAPEPIPQPFLRTSPAGFSAALSALIDRARDIGSRPVLVTMLPLAKDAPLEVQTIFEECAAYNLRIRTMAEKRGVPLVDLAEPMPTDAFAADGLHLTSVGQQWTADRVFSVLEAAGLWTALAQRGR